MSRGRTLAIRTAAACLALLLAELIVTPRIAAHPMGNFSISHYAAIRLERDGVVVRYLVDLAEIPTFQEAQDAALVAEPGHATLAPYLARQAERLKDGLRLEVDGRRRELAVVSRAIAVSPGLGGLPTLKLDMVYRAAVDSAGSSGAHLAYRDTNFPERVGWKEIVATAGPGVELLRSSVPATDRSGVLTDYPSDLLNSPPRVLEAEVVFSVAHPGTVTTSATPGSSAPVEATRGSRAPVGATPASVAVSPSPRPTRPPAAAAGTVATGTVAAGTVAAGATASDPIPGAIPAPAVTSIGATPRAKGDAIDSAPADDPGVLEAGRARGRRDRVTEMMGSPAHGIGVILLAALGAIAMGAFHALEPGHGKTVVAAYLVGARGTARHALLLGLTVTASHTAGVYLLGVVTLYASRYVVPERLYPWLGALSGLVIAGLGFTLFLRRYAAGAHGLDHAHVHAHAHPPDGSPAHRHVHAPVGHPHDHGHGHALDAVAHHDPHEHDHAHRHANAHAHRQEHDHATDHADAHGHGRGQGHSHHLGAGHGHHHHLPPGRAVSLRQLVALGVSGGIVPCPAALVVLLSAVALGRVGFGLFLILAFSVGLAAVLVAIGLVMVYARHLVTRLEGDGPLVTRWLPLASSAVMTVLGLAIALQAMMAADIVQIRLG